MGWIAIIEFGLGVFLRLFNEHNKQKAVDHKMTLALVSQKTPNTPTHHHHPNTPNLSLIHI